MSRIATRLIASLVIAVILIYWLVEQGFDVLPSAAHIRAVVTWWGIPLYTGLFVLFNVLRAWRWIYLVRPFAKVNPGPMMEVAFLGFVAIQMMPLRTGEVARPYLLDRYAGISKSALFGTIAIERVIDGLIVSLILTAALFTIPASDSSLVWGLRLLPLLLFTLSLALLVAFYFRPQKVKALIEKLCRLISKKLAEFAVGVLERFHAGLAALPDHRHFWAFVILSVIYWGINGVSFYWLAHACGLELTFAGALAGMGCLAVGILLPAGPGYFGNFQVSVLTSLELYLPLADAPTQMAVFVFLLYVLQTGLTLLFGGVSALRLRYRPIQQRSQGTLTSDS